jgi:hypothetical protein
MAYSGVVGNCKKLMVKNPLGQIVKAGNETG